MKHLVYEYYKKRLKFFKDSTSNKILLIGSAMLPWMFRLLTGLYLALNKFFKPLSANKAISFEKINSKLLFL